jgi:hypothetical protein
MYDSYYLYCVSCKYLVKAEVWRYGEMERFEVQIRLTRFSFRFCTLGSF